MCDRRAIDVGAIAGRGQNRDKLQATRRLLFTVERPKVQHREYIGSYRSGAVPHPSAAVRDLKALGADAGGTVTSRVAIERIIAASVTRRWGFGSNVAP